ncbi:MAG: nucleotidyltransferase family protein [Acidimicrobiales bacterium]
MSAGTPGAYPTAEQELLLRAVVSDPEVAVASWQQWKALTGGLADHDEASYRVMPMLYRRLSSHVPDDAALATLKGVYRHTWYQNQRLLHLTEQLLHTLDDAGIPTLLLKGAAMIEVYYRDAGMRPMVDVDVLVPDSRVLEAFRLLAGAGWKERTCQPYSRLRVTHHAAEWTDEKSRAVDLHWNALHVPASDDAFWAAAVPVKVRSAGTLALCPADQLLHLLAHGTGPFGAPVMWVADAMTVLQACGDASPDASAEPLDWDRLVRGAIDRGLTVRVARALRYLESGFAVAVPAATMASLSQARPAAGERLSEWALVHEPRHGAAYLHHWDRWRRVRAVYPKASRPVDFLEYLSWQWQLESRRQLGRRLLRKAVQIARYGRSDPTGAAGGTF